LPQVDGSLSSTKFTKLEFKKGVKIHDIQLDIGEEKRFLDLHPITNTSPCRVVETMSSTKVYTLFQQLGLCHLCVMPKSSKVHIKCWVFGVILIWHDTIGLWILDLKFVIYVEWVNSLYGKALGLGAFPKKMGLRPSSSQLI